MKALLFSAQGRIGRGQFWKGAVLSTLAMLVVLTIANLILAQFVSNEASDDGAFRVTGAAAIPMLIVNFAVIGLFAWASICLGIKRFHDRGKPGIWVLISFVPIIGGVWYLIETGFLKGTDGPNAYGPDPLGSPVPAGSLAAMR